METLQKLIKAEAEKRLVKDINSNYLGYLNQLTLEEVLTCINKSIASGMNPNQRFGFIVGNSNASLTSFIYDKNIPHYIDNVAEEFYNKVMNTNYLIKEEDVF